MVFHFSYVLRVAGSMSMFRSKFKTHFNPFASAKEQIYICALLNVINTGFIPSLMC